MYLVVVWSRLGSCTEAVQHRRDSDAVSRTYTIDGQKVDDDLRLIDQPNESLDNDDITAPD